MPPKPDFKVENWRKVINLRDGEYVVEGNVVFEEEEGNFPAHNVGSPEEFLQCFFNGRAGLVLTNQRLIILRKVGHLQEGTAVGSFEVEKEFPLESIKDMVIVEKEISRERRGQSYPDIVHIDHKAIFYVTEGKYETWMDDDGVSFGQFRKKVISQKGKKAMFSLDFSSLKSIMERGGIVLTTLSCPKCDGPVKMPEEGNETFCQHCGSTVYAQDILKKLKTLLS